MISNFAKLQCNDRSLVVPLDYQGDNDLFVSDFNVFLDSLDPSNFVLFSLEFYNEGLMVGAMSYKSASGNYLFTYVSGYQEYDKFFDELSEKLVVKPVKSEL